MRLAAKMIRKFLADRALCYREARRCRGRASESAGVYALASVESTELCEEVRRRNPGRRIFWSFSTNHSGDAVPSHVAIWSIDSQICQTVTATLVFHGTRGVLRKRISGGHFDDVLERYERRQASGSKSGVCPECHRRSVVAKPLDQGGGEACTTPGCGYWFCF